MLGVGLWGGAKGNSHTSKGHRVGASVDTCLVYRFKTDFHHIFLIMTI